MTRVGNSSEHVLLLLREQLRRLDRTRGASRTSATLKPTPGPMARLRALEGVSEREYKKTLVRALLSEQLGDAVANDPAFQSVVEDVHRILGDTEEGRDLLDRAAKQLRAGA